MRRSRERRERRGFENHPARVDPEVLDAPDGDPAKRGTIHAAVPIGADHTFGPLDVFAPTPADDTEGRLLVATRHSALVAAQSIDEGLAHFYEDERARRSARAALLDTEPWRRR